MFVSKHKSGKSNRVIDVLTQRKILLNTMLIAMVSLECVKWLYEKDAYFTEAWKECKETRILD
jgi:hypothetical protein